MVRHHGVLWEGRTLCGGSRGRTPTCLVRDEQHGLVTQRAADALVEERLADLGVHLDVTHAHIHTVHTIHGTTHDAGPCSA